MKKILNCIFIFNVLVFEKLNSAEENTPFKIKLYSCFEGEDNSKGFKTKKQIFIDGGEFSLSKIDNLKDRAMSQEKPDSKIIKPLRKGSDQVTKNDLNLKENVPFLDLLKKNKNLNNNLIIRLSSPLKNNKGPVKPK